jgi:hypothetical protein
VVATTAGIHTQEAAQPGWDAFNQLRRARRAAGIRDDTHLCWHTAAVQPAGHAAAVLIHTRYVVVTSAGLVADCASLSTSNHCLNNMYS